jgi:hypothetical protein
MISASMSGFGLDVRARHVWIDGTVHSDVPSARHFVGERRFEALANRANWSGVVH